MRPRILLIHGFLSGPASWHRLRRHLEDAAETIAPPLPGFGGSTSPSNYTLESVADAFAPVVAAAQPTHILGHSMGAIVALELARRHPGRFQGVGLLNLPVFESRGDGLRYLHQRGPLHRILLHSDRASHAGCRVMAVGRWAWTPFIPWFANGSPPAHLHAAFRHSRAGHGAALERLVFAGLVPALAEAVSTPVVMLHGAQDRAAPPERAAALASVHHWQMTVVPGRHQLMVDRPRLVARWVRTHLLHEGEHFSESQPRPTLAP